MGPGKQQQGSGQQQFQRYKSIWDQLRKEHGLLESEYTPRNIAVMWLERIEQSAQAQYDDAICEYLRDVHQLDEKTITNVEFKFKEMTQLLEWYRNKQKSENKEQIPIHMNEQEQKKYMRQNYGQENREQSDKEESLRKQQQEPPLETQNNEQQHQNQFQQLTIPSERTNHQPQNPATITISKKYVDHLHYIFDHYCRMSYATGNDPTFEQIKEKTHTMTINKFMIFCKEFGILTLSSITRPILLELFKKNSKYYKEMNFQQFQQVLTKISEIVYNDKSVEKEGQVPKQYAKLLVFMDVHDHIAFRNKMKNLKITYQPRGTSDVKKPVLSNYKFRYKATNGKSEEQVKEEIKQRKKIRSENKIKVHDVSKHRESRDMLKRNLKPTQNYKNTQSKKTIPPQHKVVTPLAPLRKPTSNQKIRNEDNAVTGYANIYRIKRSKMSKNNGLQLNSIVEDAKRIINISKSQSYYHDPSSYHQRQQNYTPASDSYDQDVLASEKDPALSHMRNNLDYELVDSHHYNILDTEPPKRQYHAYGHSALQKHPKIKKTLPDLQGLIDNDSDEDQFLNEHLERQHKNNHFSNRIQAKIKQLHRS